MQFAHFIWIASAAVGGGGVGWLLDRIVLGRLRRFARRSQSLVDDVLVGALKGILPLWGALIGVRFTLRSFDLPASVADPSARLLLGLTVFSFCVVATRMASAWIQHTTSGLVGGTKTASIMGIVMRA
ncbi:MAG: hypothetical protein IPH53_02235 [Flavobacteriales bacterium]|nr:hypothetical protein [Flavobacteriales bacterium]